MANYNQSSITGETWTRAYQVFVDNKYGEVPSITFNEEDIVNTGTTTISKHVYSLNEPFIDPNTQFNLLDLNDGTVIGAATYQDVKTILFSLYMALAAKRDAATV